MKNLFRLALLSVALVFSSCVVNDDEDTSVDLVGTWKMTSFTISTPYDLNGDGTPNTDILVETGCYQNETLDFNDNGSGVSTNRSYLDIEVELVTGTTDQYNYNIDCVDEFFQEDFTWSQTGSSVAVTIGAFTVLATQSADTLTLVIPSGFSLEIPDGNGATFTLNETVTVVYTKQ